MVLVIYLNVDPLIFLSFTLTAMSLPLSLLIYMHFANSKYGKVMLGISAFIIFLLFYFGFEILEVNILGIRLSEISGLLACFSILYTSIIMIKIFIPGGV